MTLYNDFIAWLFESFLQPVLFQFGMMNLSEQAFNWLWLAGTGVLFMVMLCVTIGPLEKWRPVEPVSDPAAVRNDIGYTALAQLGLLPLIPAAFLALLFDPFDAWVRTLGFEPWSLERAFPGLTQSPLAAFIVYLVLIDFTLYWLHRSQHIFRPLWELHAIHHSQQQMTFWSDAREHIVSYIYYALVVAGVGLLIGAGRESAFLVAAYGIRFIQSLSHANLRVSFGSILGRILVSPQFHRVHHAIGIGHEGPHAGVNFASVFAIWDVIFCTANLRNIYPKTGIRDQLSGQNYGRAFFSQQWLALKRVVQR